ncbi:unnamed protein product [Pylaiella littoralis]
MIRRRKRLLCLGAVIGLTLPTGARPRLHDGSGASSRRGEEATPQATGDLGTENGRSEKDQLLHARVLWPEHWFHWNRGDAGKEKGPEMEQELEGEGDSQMATRDYLNGLVAAAAADTDQQSSNIAFIKTHKTASTTMAFLLFRYARRHGAKLAHFDGHNTAIPLNEAVQQTRDGKGRCDIMHYHISTFGEYDGSWEHAEQQYRQLMRDPAGIHFITVLREPRSHFLRWWVDMNTRKSYYYYFMQPQTQKSIEDFLTQRDNNPKSHKRLFNPLAAEFGVKTPEDLRYMVETALPNLKLVILTEDFDEGLMVMRRLFGWSMIDMTYVTVLKTISGRKRYDGKKLVESPRFEDLPQHVQKTIDGLTHLDQMLYDAAKREYEERRAPVAQYLEADLAEFQKLQGVVKAYLEDNPDSGGNIMYSRANIYAPEEQTPMYEF